MNQLSTFVRFINKTNYFIPNNTLVAYDCHILYNLKHDLNIKFNENQYVLQSHSLIYFPYSTPYSINSSSDNILFYTANFDLNKKFTTIKNALRPEYIDNYKPKNNLDSISIELQDIFKKTIYIKHAVDFEKYFEEMYKKTISRSLNWSSIQDEIMGIILNKIHRIISAPRTSNSICDEIKKIIKSNYTDISNYKTAEKLGYHSNYLNNIFKQNNGITIHQYVMQKNYRRHTN